MRSTEEPASVAHFALPLRAPAACLSRFSLRCWRRYSKKHTAASARASAAPAATATMMTVVLLPPPLLLSRMAGAPAGVAVSVRAQGGPGSASLHTGSCRHTALQAQSCRGLPVEGSPAVVVAGAAPLLAPCWVQPTHVREVGGLLRQSASGRALPPVPMQVTVRVCRVAGAQVEG
jgi:hypothetical protein